MQILERLEAGPSLSAVAFAVAWLPLMLAYSPCADTLASRWIQKPPTLKAFRGLQQSRTKLVLGIIVAWILGGFLEELIFRGIILQKLEVTTAAWVFRSAASAIAICATAVAAGFAHLYQGLRAVVIVTQLSVLFGLLFVVSGHNLCP